MKITWVTRSFLDYRVPVYAELDKLCCGNLTLLYYGDVVPQRAAEKVKDLLGERAVALSGEWRIAGRRSNINSNSFSNKGIRVPIQPGLVKTAHSSKPDILVSDGFFQWTYAPLWIRMTRKIPHVMCYERTDHTERNAQWYRIAYRKFVMRWIDAICCNGSLCGDYVKSLGYPTERLTFGHMVADTAGLSGNVMKVPDDEVAGLKRKLGAKGTVFLYVGRLIKLKGIAEYLRAWKAFNSKSAESATLILVGDGPQRQELEKYAADNGLDNVVFTGRVDYDSIALYYKLADVFVIPTLEDNWSLVVPEAMASGLPVMCSKYNGCHPELVTPENGWVFDPLDKDDTMARLLDAIDSKDKFENMGQASRQIIENGHTPKHAANAVYKACELAINA